MCKLRFGAVQIKLDLIRIRPWRHWILFHQHSAPKHDWSSNAIETERLNSALETEQRYLPELMKHELADSSGSQASQELHLAAGSSVNTLISCVSFGSTGQPQAAAEAKDERIWFALGPSGDAAGSSRKDG